METSGLERILNSALALYSKYGIKSITLDDLCRDLGISKKTLYQHIHDKKDLIWKVMEYERHIQENNTKKMYRAGINAIDELMYVNRMIHENESIHSPTFYFDLKKYYPDLYGEWIEYKRKRMYEVIRRNLQKGIEEGLFRKDLDPDIISRLHMVRTETMHTSEILEDNERSASRFLHEVFRYHIHGICNEKGLAYFREKEAQNLKKSERS